MILNLRGPSGAGKSYPGFCLLRDYGPPVEEVRTTEYFPNRKTGRPRTKPKLVAQVLPGGLCLAGRYVMKKSTRTGGAGYSGGVDGFYPMDELQRLIQDLCDRYPHVLFESLMVSGTHERWKDFAVANADKQVVFATLDTPHELCVERVLGRNGGRPVKEDQMKRHNAQVHRCAQKFVADGLTSYMIDHKQSYEQVRGLFASAGWNPIRSESAPGVTWQPTEVAA